jgi:hypothetical protein
MQRSLSRCHHLASPLLFSFPLREPSGRFVSCSCAASPSFIQLVKSPASKSAMARRQSLESAQSFEFLSPPSGSQISEFSSGDDEIVWGVSSLSLNDRVLFSPRSEDYVVLSPPSVISSHATGLRPFIEDDLISNPPIFSQPPTPQPHSPSRRNRKKRNCNAHAQQQSKRAQAPPQSPLKPSDGKAPPSPQSPKRRRKRSEKRNDASPPGGKCQSLVVAPPAPGPTKGLGARSIVDDVSERGDDNDSAHGSELSSNVYDKAVQYINWCVVSPVCRSGAVLVLI